MMGGAGGVRSFEPPTQSQIFFLKRLSAGDGGLRLEEGDLQKLSKERASALIDSFLRNGRKAKAASRGGNGKVLSNNVSAGAGLKGFGLFSSNYRADSGAWQVARMSSEEEARLRGLHAEHCRAVLQECLSEFGDRPDVAVALFEKRADKFFSWAQAFLEEKVRLERVKVSGGGCDGSR